MLRLELSQILLVQMFFFDGIGGTRIGTFTNGAVAEVLEDNGPWLKVKLIDNTIGYIISI